MIGLEEAEQVERVNISPTPNCNLKCRYCYFFNPERKIKQDRPLSSMEILTILNNVRDYLKTENVRKNIKINFVGNGEPLLSWSDIELALEEFKNQNLETRMKFYTVTNGTLLNPDILDRMKELKIFPSISIDGPKIVNDTNRLTKTADPTFDHIIKTLGFLKDAGLDIAINTTITWDIINHLDDFFRFVAQNEIKKVIFGRLVDVPSIFKKMSYDDFYESLILILKKWRDTPYNFEIGNFESYRRAFLRRPDKVCVVFGNCCGAGLSNLIYLQREVFPCGRVFDQPFWKIGSFSDALIDIQGMMKEKLAHLISKSSTYRLNLSKCETCKYRVYCVQDCILDMIRPEYDCSSRQRLIDELQIDFLDKNSKLNKMMM